MIRRFAVKSFKSLVDVEVELGQVNLFIGANGSGKSNLLEALGVLGAAISGRVDDESLLRRGVRPGVPVLYKSSFRGRKARHAIRFEAEAEKASYAVELNNPLHDPSPAWRYQTEKFESRGQKIVGRSNRRGDHTALNPEAGLTALKLVELGAEEPGTKLASALRDYCIYTPNTSTLRGLESDPQQREPVGLSGGRLPEAVRELLVQSESDERISGICSELLELIDWAHSFGAGMVDDVPLSPSVSSQRQALVFQDRFMAQKRNILTGYDASEGALYVLLAAVLAVHPKAPKVLAIDNADHGLNPRLVRSLMERLCSWVLSGPDTKQLLLTTHNPLVLDGLPLRDDRVRLFTVDRSRKGLTFVRRVEVTEELLEKSKQGWTLSRLWVMGHLGGVPNV